MRQAYQHRLIVAGGGTGGHVLAGIAIADAWKLEFGADASVLFVGARQGLESRLVPKHGYQVELLDLGPLNRVSLKVRIKTAIQLPISFLRAAFILLRFRPTAVIGVGGYASGPVVLLARVFSALMPLFNVKTAILEQNSVSGFTNRVLGRWVSRVYLAFARDTATNHEADFDPRKVLLTGNPIRSHLTKMPSATETKGEPTIFIFGGSQGALGMNTMVIDALPYLKEKPIRWIHQTGAKDFERVQAAYQRVGMLDSSRSGQVRIEKFIDDMASCYQQAHLVICRAGASTLSELAAVGRAAIFVPLPTAADNHQELNARIYVNGNAGRVVAQGSMTGAAFADLIGGLIDQPEEIVKIENQVVKFYRKDAAKILVQDLGAE